MLFSRKFLNLQLFNRTVYILLLNLQFSASSNVTPNMSTVENTDCLFCKIASGSEPSKMVYQDTDYLVFNDIKPAAKFHYLVIPRQHIKNAAKLKGEENGPEIVRKLVSIGKQVLESNGGDLNDVRMGFHWPPFNSISHLHLHVISPASEMSFLSNTIFKPNTFWFTTPEKTLEHLGADSKL